MAGEDLAVEMVQEVNWEDLREARQGASATVYQPHTERVAEVNNGMGEQQQ